MVCPKQSRAKISKKRIVDQSKTNKQILGDHGELLVITHCMCPGCKREKSLKRLRANFKCADIICDFCGFLGQVKTARVQDISKLPKRLPGAAWFPQSQRMEAGIYISLYIVLVDTENKRKWAIYFLPAELQKISMFEMRKPLSGNARRAGWQGFSYNLSLLQDGSAIRLM